MSDLSIKKTGHGVAVCIARHPPEAAVLAAKVYLDSVNLTNEGVLAKPQMLRFPAVNPFGVDGGFNGCP